jgi:hypothetical protein
VVPHETRDQIVDFIRRWSEKTEIGAGRFIGWLDVAASKFYDRRERQGERAQRLGSSRFLAGGFHLKNPLEGYRRLTFMMLDANIVAVSPSSVWRVLLAHRRVIHQHQRNFLLPVQRSGRL